MPRLRACPAAIAMLLLFAAPAAAAPGPGIPADLIAPRHFDVRFDGDAGGTATLSGGRVADAGDVNGDGRQDLIVGAPADGTGAPGGAYVRFGATEPASVRRTEALSASGGGGFAITPGGDPFAGLGIAVAGAGDVNGDGLDDVLVSSQQEVGGAGFRGATWVVFGRTATTPVDLTNLGGQGFQIIGRLDPSGSSHPFSADGGEDVNGDGLDDVVLGFPGFDAPGGVANDNTGEAFVVFGRTATTPLDVAALGGAGFRVAGGADGHNAGNGVALTPDMTGDGRAEVVVGSPGSAVNGSQSGEAAVVFGRTATTDVALSALGGAGFRVEGEFRHAIGSRLGNDVTGGDLNGDGVGDVVLSTPALKPTAAAVPSTLFAGGAVVVFGRSSTAPLEADALGAAGYRIVGTGSFQSLGLNGAGVGDLDGDGLAELAIGAAGEPANGRVWIVRGRPPGSPDVDLAAPAGAATKMDLFDDSAANSRPWLAITDRNTDGLGDLVALSPFADVSGPDDGAVYVIHGRAAQTTLDLAAPPFPGARLEGPDAGALAGTSVAAAGDVNGDGRADRIVGAPDSALGANDGGAAHVVFGTGTLPGLDLAALGAGGFRIDGGEFENAGFEVDGAGDVDGDGLDDVILHSFDGPGGNGAASVVYGKTTTTPVSLGALGSGGFTVAGFAGGQRLGSQVAGVGDMNGDGRDDIAFSNPTEAPGGKIYVVFGKSPRRTGAQLIADIDSPDGFAITAPANSFLGQLDPLGDVNADGKADLLITGRAANAYVVYGRAATTTIDVGALGAAGYVIDLGNTVNGDDAKRAAALGDVNGDGRMDLGFAGTLGPSGRAGSGAVLFGKGPLDPPNDPVDLAAAIGAGRGFLVEGPPGDAFAGEGVAEIAPAGDIDGDGLSDIVVGGPREDPLGRVDAGTAWLVFGRPGPAFVDLTRLGYDGLHLAGPVAGGLLGGAADAIGAADADGRPDLLVGAPQLTALGRTSAGAVFQLSGAALPRPLPPGTDPGPGPGGGGPGGGGPGAGAPPPAAAADRSAPALSAVSLRPRRFKAGKAPRGTTIRWTLSEPAATTFTIERLSPGRRAGKRCAAPTARNRRARACVRAAPAGRLRANGRAGANRLRFTGRVGRRTLRPGSYRLTARATDAAGNASARRTATFTLTR